MSAESNEIAEAIDRLTNAVNRQNKISIQLAQLIALDISIKSRTIGVCTG